MVTAGRHLEDSSKNCLLEQAISSSAPRTRTVPRSANGARQSQEAQNSLRACNCNRNDYFFYFPLRIGTKRHAGLRQVFRISNQPV